MAINSKAALKKRARVESLKELSYHFNQKKGSKAVVAAVDTSKSDGNCQSSGSSLQGSLSDKQKQKYYEVKRRVGDCKMSKSIHEFQSRWMKSPLPNDRFLNCPKFKT